MSTEADPKTRLKVFGVGYLDRDTERTRLQIFQGSTSGLCVMSVPAADIAEILLLLVIAPPCAGLLFLEMSMIEIPATTPVYLRPRKEPMTLEDRKSGMRDVYRRDPDMARLAAQELGDNKPFMRAMDDYLVLTVTHGLTAAVTLEAAAKLQGMMVAKLREWADSEAEDIHNKSNREAA